MGGGEVADDNVQSVTAETGAEEVHQSGVYDHCPAPAAEITFGAVDIVIIHAAKNPPMLSFDLCLSIFRLPSGRARQTFSDE